MKLAGGGSATNVLPRQFYSLDTLNHVRKVHCTIVCLLGSVVLWFFGPVVLWLSGSVVQWFCSLKMKSIHRFRSYFPPFYCSVNVRFYEKVLFWVSRMVTVMVFVVEILGTVFPRSQHSRSLPR